ncbi:Bidirectional sugar transporter SWEET16 [Platanthera zijinensis]|uniref:Bidirectional sugar transporter SWEET n=1 Tax=Platanthera zijinensis TaxID=2320716 RepID=A0AAP0BQ28_9ASPA
MANWSFIVGLAAALSLSLSPSLSLSTGNAISILVFTSPIGTFRRVVKSKSTENYKWQPYVTTLMSTSLWTFYGLLKPDGLLVVTVNGAGSLLQAVYVLLYLSYAPMKTRIKIAKLVGLLNVGVLGAVILVTLSAVHGRRRLLLMGSLCAALTVGMYAAPLSAMRLVVKTKSVEYMPFSLSFFLLLNAGIWTVYSFLVKDFFIGIPNGIGVLLGTAQLAIFFIYKKNAGSAKEEDTEKSGLEDDSAQLVGYSESQSLRKEEDNGKMTTTTNLNKGRSLPKPASMAKQNSFSGIIKTMSLTPYELQSLWKADGRYNAL